MFKKIMALTLIIIVTGCGSQDSTTDNGTYLKITPEEAKDKMTGDAIILDVRTPEEFAQGHIKGAVLLPVDRIEEEAASKFPDKDQTILVYCRSGNRSQSAAEALIGLGYTEVFDFGGINTWIEPLVVD